MSTATLGPAGLLPLGGAASRFVADAAVTIGAAAYASINGDQADTVTGFPVMMGDGVTNAATIHPAITTVSALYRTDWQGKQLLYSTERTNLLSYTKIFTNAYWTKSAVTLAALVTGPSGAVDATPLYETATTAAHYLVRPGFAVTSGQTYTVFADVHPGNVNACVLEIYGTARKSITVTNLTAGTFNIVGTNATGSITALQNGFYRVAMQFVADAYATPDVGFYLKQTEVYLGAITNYLVLGCLDLKLDGLSSYINNATTPAPLTDYTLTGNVLTLGEVPARNAEITLDGVATGLPLYWPIN